LSSQYAGNPASFPVDFTIPDDGEPRTAASVDIAFEALGDRTAYLNAAKTSLATPVTYTASTTVTAPAGATFAIIYAWGGGGGGAAGDNNQGASMHTCGGGGGGGSVAYFAIIPIVGGESYIITIGAGGVGGDAAHDGGDNGGDTTVTRVSTGEVIFRAMGAGGGVSGQAVGASGDGDTDDIYSWGLGGRPCRLNTFDESQLRPVFWSAIARATAGPPFYFNTSPQVGCNGVTGNSALRDKRGGSSPQGYLGGTNGSGGGSPAASYYPGGSGGGGGAGPGGNGGNGGNGGAANNAGAPGTGGSGASAAANSGAGGGGGGATGCGSGANASFGAGGAGGSGCVKSLVFGGNGTGF
jgi:hypothetical protein